jgi:hypothetical protein
VQTSHGFLSEDVNKTAFQFFAIIVHFTIWIHHHLLYLFNFFFFFFLEQRGLEMWLLG